MPNFRQRRPVVYSLVEIWEGRLSDFPAEDPNRRRIAIVLSIVSRRLVLWTPSAPRAEGFCVGSRTALPSRYMRIERDTSCPRSLSQRFASLSEAEIYQIAGEIAVLGYGGLDYTSTEPNYTLRFLPGETFSGLQLICLMYVGFKRVQPEWETGIPLQEAYQRALAMYENQR